MNPPGYQPSPTRVSTRTLAKEARRLAAMPEDKLEAHVKKAVSIAVAAIEGGNNAVIKEARAERHRERKKKRTERERKLGEKLVALPQKKYGVILADPEWALASISPCCAIHLRRETHWATQAHSVVRKKKRY